MGHRDAEGLCANVATGRAFGFHCGTLGCIKLVCSAGILVSSPPFIRTGRPDSLTRQPRSSRCAILASSLRCRTLARQQTDAGGSGHGIGRVAAGRYVGAPARMRSVTASAAGRTPSRTGPLRGMKGPNSTTRRCAPHGRPARAPDGDIPRARPRRTARYFCARARAVPAGTRQLGGPPSGQAQSQLEWDGRGPRPPDPSQTERKGGGGRAGSASSSVTARRPRAAASARPGQSETAGMAAAPWRSVRRR